MKTMTLRLDDKQHAQLEAIARADGTNVTDAIRTAVDEHVAARRRDPEFRARVRDIIEREREVLELLSK